jgi:hypothetical protein
MAVLLARPAGNKPVEVIFPTFTLQTAATFFAANTQVKAANDCASTAVALAQPAHTTLRVRFGSFQNHQSREAVIRRD